MFSAFGCGVHMRQPLRWCTITRELRRIYTTNCNVSLEAVLVCQVIHEVYLRVSKHRATHQTSAGSERAIIVYWMNNHHSLIHVPYVSEASQGCHRAPLSLGQRAVKEVLSSLTFCSCFWLGALPSPSNHCSSTRHKFHRLFPAPRGGSCTFPPPVRRCLPWANKSQSSLK